MTAKEFLTRYDAGENFEERDLEDIFYLDFEEDEDDICQVVEEEYDEPLRWVRPHTRWVNINGRYFELNRYEALTELQDNEYWQQPQEVSCKQVTRTIVVTENQYTYIERGVKQ